MARTESISFQVHPNDEQEQINFMQLFHWSLLNSQEIKSIDNHLERRGDDIYQVRNNQHYVKLTFSRDLSLPNLGAVRQIENEFHSLPMPRYPRLFPLPWWLFVIGSFFFFIGPIAWVLYFILGYLPKKRAADETWASTSRRRTELLDQVAQYS